MTKVTLLIDVTLLHVHLHVTHLHTQYIQIASDLATAGVTVTMYVRNDKAAKKEPGARSQTSQARKSEHALFFHLYRILPRADSLIFFTEYCPFTGSCRGPICCSWYIGIYSHTNTYAHTHTHTHTNNPPPFPLHTPLTPHTANMMAISITYISESKGCVQDQCAAICSHIIIHFHDTFSVRVQRRKRCSV